jgi:hypothetical protein
MSASTSVSFSRARARQSSEGGVSSENPSKSVRISEIVNPACWAGRPERPQAYRAPRGAPRRRSACARSSSPAAAAALRPRSNATWTA